MTTINLQIALDRGMSLNNEKALDAATIAIAEQSSGQNGLSLDAAVATLGNDQISELAGFLSESMSCQQLEKVCDTQHVDLEQAREWNVTSEQYCRAHEIALLSHKIERKREGLV